MCIFCRSLFVLLYFFCCRSLFVLLFFFFCPLCCLFFDLQTLITPLVSSNSSFKDRCLSVCTFFFSRSVFVLLFFFLCPLCCLFFDLQILITPLVSSNSSFLDHWWLIVLSDLLRFTDSDYLPWVSSNPLIVLRIKVVFISAVKHTLFIFYGSFHKLQNVGQFLTLKKIMSFSNLI